MAGRDDLLSLEATDDLETMAEILGEVAQERQPGLLKDDETYNTWLKTVSTRGPGRVAFNSVSQQPRAVHYGTLFPTRLESDRMPNVRNHDLLMAPTGGARIRIELAPRGQLVYSSFITKCDQL